MNFQLQTKQLFREVLHIIQKTGLPRCPGHFQILLRTGEIILQRYRLYTRHRTAKEPCGEGKDKNSKCYFPSYSRATQERYNPLLIAFGGANNATFWEIFP